MYMKRIQAGVFAFLMVMAMAVGSLAMPGAAGAQTVGGTTVVQRNYTAADGAAIQAQINAIEAQLQSVGREATAYSEKFKADFAKNPNDLTLAIQGITQMMKYLEQMDALTKTITALRELIASPGGAGLVTSSGSASASGVAVTTKEFCYNWARNLKVGDSGADVAALHRALERAGFTIPLSEQPQKGGSDFGGGYFGEGTATAVSGFQAKYRAEILTPNGLAVGNGYVGNATRAKLNALYKCANSGVGQNLPAGTIGVFASPSSVIQNVNANVPGQVIGEIVVRNQTDESIAVNSIDFSVYSENVAVFPNMLTNVILVNRSNVVVAGPVDISSSDLFKTAQVKFRDTVVFPSGESGYVLKGKISSTAKDSLIQVYTNPSVNWATPKGATTGKSLAFTAVGDGVVRLKPVNVKGPHVVFKQGNYPTTRIVSAGSGIPFSSFLLDATRSSEDLRVSGLGQLYLTVGNGGKGTDLSQCRLYSGVNELSSLQVVNPSRAESAGYTMLFERLLTVPKGTVVQIDLKCNLSSGATSGATYQWGIQSNASGFYAAGVETSNNATLGWFPTTPENSIIITHQPSSAQPSSNNQSIPTAVKPTLTLLSPNGGESYREGDVVTVRWMSSNSLANNKVTLSLTDASGNPVKESILNTSLIPNTASYVWTIPVGIFAPGSSGMFKMVLKADGVDGVRDTSDAAFTIHSSATVNTSSTNTASNTSGSSSTQTTPLVTITSPARGTTLYKGQGYIFETSSATELKNVVVKIDNPAAVTVKTFTIPVLSAKTSYYWVIPSTWMSGQYLITATVDGKRVSIYNNIFDLTPMPGTSGPTSFFDQLQQIANGLTALQALLQTQGQ